ncbi:MAG TPA: protein kinase, partial [Gemmatimonadales bacterium]|nr:protein kinase [Gemmatimonadales bacterium]
MTRRLVRDGQLHDSRYRVERELGSGGMATVYLARDLKHDRLVALKILSTELAAVLGPDRFLREIRLTAGLDHPHILPLLDSGQTGGLLYYAMPYVEGESLRQRLDRESQLSLEEALRVTREVGDALAHAHARGIIHRDVKPENILLAAGSPGHARLADFGIARVVHTAGGDTLTSAGVAIGTPLYMSPEQSGGGNALGPSSDVYSLACVLYEMLAGHPPYLGATPGAILVRKATEPMPGLRLVRPAVPEGVEAALRRALSPVPVDRYPDVAAFLEALDLTGGEAPMAAAPGPRSRRAWRLAAAGGAVAAFVAAVALLVLRSDRGVVPAYEPLTSFDDLVSWPRLSPDGRQLAFMRGGQLYVKPMPDGEPVRLTDDPVAKRRPAFSPDGSRIAFDRGEEVWVIPALGGTPRLLLANATALTWADPQHLLFSERRTGIHLVVVTSDESRGGLRDIYVPPTDQGMAHESYLSPDRRHVLVQEMDATGDLPCRVVPFLGGSGPGERVGPPGGACRGGTWSADGRWIYLSVTIGGQTHLWRQRFPGG